MNDTVTNEQDTTAPDPALITTANTPLFDFVDADFSRKLLQRQANQLALFNFCQDKLKRGVDYGPIHIVGRTKCQALSNGQECTDASHYSKDVLFKPGSEKILIVLGLTPVFPSMNKYELAILEGKEIQHVVLRCELIDHMGRIVGSGIGARNIQSDLSGFGQNKQVDLNKSLKMAAKSAQIDATIRTAALSALYTQDLDDMPPDDALPPATDNNATGSAVVPVITPDEIQARSEELKACKTHEALEAEYESYPDVAKKALILDYSECQLNLCTTLEQLGEVFLKFDPPVRKALEAQKNKLKEKFSKKGE